MKEQTGTTISDLETTLARWIKNAARNNDNELEDIRQSVCLNPASATQRMHDNCVRIEAFRDVLNSIRH